MLGIETEDPAAIERMAAGTALHAAFEHLDESALPGEMATLEWNGYRFDFNCAIDLVIPDAWEIKLQASYAGMLVTGRADGICPETNLVIDYKTTQRFDFDRYMESFQWKFYLDMSRCDKMLYQVFVMKPFGKGRPEHSYSITEFHTLSQYRYPTLHEDCLQLVRDYRETVVGFLEKMTN